MGSQQQRSSIDQHPVDDLIKGFQGLVLQQKGDNDDDEVDDNATAAARGVGVAIRPLKEEELEKMNVKTIKPLLKERGIKVTADKKTLIQLFSAICVSPRRTFIQVGDRNLRINVEIMSKDQMKIQIQPHGKNIATALRKKELWSLVSCSQIAPNMNKTG